MVNPGHPSKGCMTCRKRRIRCDEQRPICAKCQTSRRMCLGYSSQHSSAMVTDRILECAPATNLRHQAGETYQAIAVNGEQQFNTTAISIYPRLPAPTKSEPCKRNFNSSVLSSFEPLQESAHTIGHHRALQRQYQNAIHDLRSQLASTNGLSEGTCIPAYLFAVYEVSVTTIALSGVEY